MRFVAPKRPAPERPLPKHPARKRCRQNVTYNLAQRFSTGGTRTPRGTPAVAKGYAKKGSVKNIFG